MPWFEEGVRSLACRPHATLREWRTDLMDAGTIRAIEKGVAMSALSLAALIISFVMCISLRGSTRDGELYHSLFSAAK